VIYTVGFADWALAADVAHTWAIRGYHVEADVAWEGIKTPD